MKAKNLIFNFIRLVLAFGWLANIVFAILAFVVLTIEFTTQDYGLTTIKYPLKPAADIPSLSNSVIVNAHSLADRVQHITFQADDAVIKFQLKNTAANIVCSYLFLIAIEILLMLILNNLRKVFCSIKENMPFKQENIKRLNITALCFALFTPLTMLLSIASYQMLAANIPGYRQQFQAVWLESDCFDGLWIGLAIYVTTFVFKNGLELQKENGEFI